MRKKRYFFSNRLMFFTCQTVASLNDFTTHYFLETIKSGLFIYARLPKVNVGFIELLPLKRPKVQCFKVSKYFKIYCLT